MKILSIFCSLTAGILAGSFSADFNFLYFCAVFFLFILPWSFFCYKKNRGIFILSVLIFIFGFLSIQARVNPDLPLHHITSYLDTTEQIITGKIVSFTKHYKRKQTVTLLCQQIKTKKGRQKNITGRIKLSIYGKSKQPLEYGDIIKFKSSIKSIRNFQNPGAFDYQRYLKLKKIYGSAWTGIDKIKILTNDAQLDFSSKVIRKIEKLRIRYFFFLLNQTTYSNPVKIMASLITGKKEVIPSDIRDLFSKAGISHLLAISGLHLSIVSLLCFSLFYRFFSFVPALLIAGKSKKIAGILSIVPLILYAVFTGFSPSCQRALIMIIVLIFSLIREKEKDIISSLSFAGILILIMDPAALFSISFQLSFSAVVFIIYGASLLKHYSLLLHKNIWSKLGLMVFITLFAGLGTSPLTAHYFNIVSTIALVSNLIAIPVLGFIVLPLGLVCLIFFPWLPEFAGFIIQVCSQLILFLMKFSELLVSLPFSWSRTITLQWIEIVAIYMGFSALFLILKGYKKASIVILVLSCLLVSNFLNISSKKSFDNNLQVTVIDVGQGSSTLIQTPGGKNILVDGGGFSDISTFDTGRYIIAPFLWKKRIGTIDYVILTHPESDHLNGLIFILDNFNIKTLIKNSDKRDSSTYETMIKTCEKHDIKIYNPLEHDKNFDLNSVQLKFVDSSKEIFSYNLNNNSLVFKLIYNNFSMLFPGDVLKQREKNLSKQMDIDLHSDVILAPHHGSSSSSTKVFLEKVSPASVIVSCGWQNRYGFPDDKVLKRYNAMGINIFRTDEHGAVSISSDGNNYKINTFTGFEF